MDEPASNRERVGALLFAVLGPPCDRALVFSEYRQGNRLMCAPIPQFTYCFDDEGDTCDPDTFELAAALSVWTTNNGVKAVFRASLYDPDFSREHIDSVQIDCSDVTYFAQHLATFMEKRDELFRL